MSRPSLKLEASVTYNKENNRFDYDADEFWKIVGEADDAAKNQMDARFRGAAAAISMSFDNENENRPVIARPIRENV